MTTYGDLTPIRSALRRVIPQRALNRAGQSEEPGVPLPTDAPEVAALVTDESFASAVAGVARDVLGCIPTIPGALGAFRRQAVYDAGGLQVDTLAEDTDLTIAVHRAGWRVVFEESARAWTEAPTGLRQLWRQRYRWSFGTMQALWKHRHAVVEKGPSGRFGRRGLLLVTVFSVLLPMLAPLLDIMAVYGLFFLDRWAAMIGWLSMMAIQFATSAVAFRLDREPLRPLWTLPLQQVFYRQLMYLVLLHSGLTALSGRRLQWQKLRRTGEVTRPAPAG